MIINILENGETESDMLRLSEYGEEYVDIYNQVRDVKRGASRIDPEFAKKLSTDDQKHTFFQLIISIHPNPQLLTKEIRENKLSFMSNLIQFKIAESITDKYPFEILETLLGYLKEGFYLITVAQLDNKEIHRNPHAIGLVIDNKNAYFFDPNFGIINFDLESDKDKRELFEMGLRNFAAYSGKNTLELQGPGGLNRALNNMGSSYCLYRVEPQ